MTTSNALVLVQKSTGEKANFSLPLDAPLGHIREILTDQGFMDESDQFLIHNAPVVGSNEDTVYLSQLVGDDGAKPLMIGVAHDGLEPPDKTVDRYNRLTTAQKLALFSNVEIYRGLTASPDKGFTRSFKPLIANWHENQLPASVKPSYLSHVTTQSTFSKVTHSLATSSVDKASASLDTPYGGGETSFSYEKSKKTSSEKVTEYLTGHFLVNKVDIQVDVANVQPVGDFTSQILAAVQGGSAIDQYTNLVNVLNARGYYIPIEFTLGGSLMSSSTTQVSTFEESESEKTDFSVGFKVAVDGFGGGADYSHSEGREQSDSTTTKYSNMSITKKGGRADAKDYDAWTTSLNPAINWDIVNITKLYPSLALLKDMRLVRYCLNILQTYATYATVKELQTVISIEKYVTQVENTLSQGNPFAD